MRQMCIVQPAILAVKLEQARRNLRVDGDYLDESIEEWVQGITSSLEHEIGQCLMPQTWQVTLEEFIGIIPLPHPVMSIESVAYLAPDMTRQMLEPSACRLLRTELQTQMVPAAGSQWPATATDSEAVTIRVICGHGSSAESTPANIRRYILAKLVEQFDPISGTERDTVQSEFVTRLLDRCRTYG